jgi:hypothetical protein
MNLDEDREPYTGCAMPVGMQAQYWRDSFMVNRPMRMEKRSVIDGLLVALERGERALLDARGEDHGATFAR